MPPRPNASRISKPATAGHPASPVTRGGSASRGLPPGSGWASRQVAALAAAWERGERVTAAEVLERYPGAETEAAVRLIFEELCLRREAGLEVDTTEVVGRHPQWNRDLRALFDCERLLRPSEPADTLPEIGETLGPFLLREELGRGASGRTFLATDATLKASHDTASAM